jgi:uncharacterized phage-associated protein
MAEEVSMVTVHDVAAAVVQRLGAMTAMKLEKLVYYCQSWHLARTGNALFSEAFEAWRQGPVAPALYRLHKRRYTLSSWEHGNAANLDDAQRTSIDWVVAEYGRFSAIELSRMTHNELPWRMARGGLPDSASCDAQIDLNIVKEFYSRQVADAETAVTLATASSALEGIEFDAQWQERLRDVATGVVTADDLVREEIERLRSG